MKIIISGGHLTPALALIDFIKAKHPDDEILFCGRFYSQNATKQPSHEVDEVTRREVQFKPFSGPKLQVGHKWWRWPGMIAALIGATWSAWVIAFRFKPDVCMSFGGYLAVPLALACWLRGVPVVTHEQTRVAGSANRFLARFVKKIAVSYPETVRFFPAHKTIVTGNPLRPNLFHRQPQPEWLSKDALTGKPLVYVTGGNQGSAVLNSMVQQMLKTLTKNWVVIHQCGRPTDQHQYLADLEQARSKLSAVGQSRYVVREWITETELAWIYQHTTTLISRAGANTVSEVIAFKLPAIFVPLPFSHYDEQTINADAIAKTGGAIVISQKELSSASLQEALERVVRYRNSMKSKLAKIELIQNSDQQLYQVLVEVTT